MAQHVAFLRAINVGGRRVEMAKLRAEVESLGLDDVSTFIASGNVIFSSRKRPATLEPLIEAHLEGCLGYPVETFVRTADQVSEITARDPFGAVEPGTTHLVAFLRGAPTAPQRRAIEAMSGRKDDLRVIGSEVHWHIDGKSLDTDLKPRDWKATVASLNTTRNITMLAKLAAKLEA